MVEFDPYDDYYRNDALPADEYIARKQALEALIDEVINDEFINTDKLQIYIDAWNELIANNPNCGKRYYQQEIIETPPKQPLSKTNTLLGRFGLVYGNKRQFKPNVTNAHDVQKALKEGTIADTMPNFDGYFIGDIRDFAEFELPYTSEFTELSIMKLTKTVRGSFAKLPKGMVVMLDRAISQKEDIYRIRVVNGGPQYMFTPSTTQEHGQEDFEAIMADGIYKYVMASNKEVKENYAAIAALEQAGYKSFETDLEWFDSLMSAQDQE